MWWWDDDWEGKAEPGPPERLFIFEPVKSGAMDTEAAGRAAAKNPERALAGWLAERTPEPQSLARWLWAAAARDRQAWPEPRARADSGDAAVQPKSPDSEPGRGGGAEGALRKAAEWLSRWASGRETMAFASANKGAASARASPKGARDARRASANPSAELAQEFRRRLEAGDWAGAAELSRRQKFSWRTLAMPAEDQSPWAGFFPGVEAAPADGAVSPIQELTGRILREAIRNAAGHATVVDLAAVAALLAPLQAMEQRDALSAAGNPPNGGEAEKTNAQADRHAPRRL
jgi:hypothetical protein